MKRSSETKKKHKYEQQPYFNYRNGSIIKANGQEIYLEYRLKDFLKILIDHEHDVVTREEIKNYVWKDVIVSDESVTKAASDLRKFFHNHKIHNFKLITIPKIGYRLEISQPRQSGEIKANFVLRSLKVVGYVFLFLLSVIVIIRAINY